jgi:hypothetical protein
MESWLAIPVTHACAWGASATLASQAVEMLVFALFVIITGAAAVFGILQQRKRREHLFAWARENGWTLEQARRNNTAYPFSLFTHGHSRYSCNHARRSLEGLIDGMDTPAEADLFEYHYAITTSDGKSSSTTHFYYSCLALRCGVLLGEVSIRDEHIGDKLVAALGRNDIDFEDPDFSKRFYVTAPQRVEAFNLINHAVMRYMVQSAGKGLAIHTIGDLMFVYVIGRASRERYQRLIDFAAGFLQQLPRTLVNAERARRGLPPVVEAGAAATRARHARTAGAGLDGAGVDGAGIDGAAQPAGLPDHGLPDPGLPAAGPVTPVAGPEAGRPG